MTNHSQLVSQCKFSIKLKRMDFHLSKVSISLAYCLSHERLSTVGTGKRRPYPTSAQAAPTAAPVEHRYFRLDIKIDTSQQNLYLHRLRLWCGAITFDSA